MFVSSIIAKIMNFNFNYFFGDLTGDGHELEWRGVDNESDHLSSWLSPSLFYPSSCDYVLHSFEFPCFLDDL